MRENQRSLPQCPQKPVNAPRIDNTSSAAYAYRIDLVKLAGSRLLIPAMTDTLVSCEMVRE